MIIVQYIFSSLLIFSSLMVIFNKNPIHSVLWLIMSFFSGAGIILLLNTEFVAMLFLVVYMGAIAVLFLFVVMMINIKIDQMNQNLVTYLPLGIIVFLIFFIEVWSSISTSTIIHINEEMYYFNWFQNVYNTLNIQVVGNVLYTYRLPCFMIAAMILLVAMVGSIVLTLSDMKGPKNQNIYKQLKQNFAKGLRLKKPKY